MSLFCFISEIKPATKREKPEICVEISELEKPLFKVRLIYLCGEGKFEIRVVDLKNRREKKVLTETVEKKDLEILLECTLCSAPRKRECFELVEKRREDLILPAFKAIILHLLKIS